MVVGSLLRFVPIKKNYFFGYRTIRSMKNNESWKYANDTFANLSMVFGIISSVCGMMAYYSQIFDYKVIVIATLALVLLSVVYIEIKLYRRSKRRDQATE